MNLTGIISISGKSGLYKVVGQGKNTIIVEALDNGKRFPTYASHKISALDDISIYTYEEDVPLREVYVKLAKLEGFKDSISHNESSENLLKKLDEFLPNWDQDRVYISDIKKLFQWYNLLIKNKVIVKEEKKEKAVKGDTETAKKTTAAKKPVAKKTTAKPVAKKAAQPANKKPTAKMTPTKTSAATKKK